MSTDLKRNRNSISSLYIHLVCVTKYREKVFNSESLDLIQKSFQEVGLKMGFEILEFEGESDHVHALISYPPKLSISQMVNALKGVSSRRYGQFGFPKPTPLNPPLEKGGTGGLWSPSYFVSSVGGAPIEVLKRYIQNQEKPN
jgi:putative transposase